MVATYNSTTKGSSLVPRGVCGKHGKCIPLSANEFKCQCEEGWTGDSCSISKFRRYEMFLSIWWRFMHRTLCYLHLIVCCFLFSTTYKSTVYTKPFLNTPVNTPVNCNFTSELGSSLLGLHGIKSLNLWACQCNDFRNLTSFDPSKLELNSLRRCF